MILFLATAAPVGAAGQLARLWVFPWDVESVSGGMVEFSD